MSGEGRPEELRDAAQWWARLADALIEAGRRSGQLTEQIARAWPDGTGREWAERAGQVGTELRREAAVAAEIGAAYAHLSTHVHPEPAAYGPVPGWSAGHRPGMRLGGTEGQRIDEERGIRIAELPEPPP
jgi:hypothetical protein